MARLTDQLAQNADEAKAQLQQALVDFGARQAAAAEENGQLRSRVDELEARGAQLGAELQNAWDMLMAAPDDVRAALGEALQSH